MGLIPSRSKIESYFLLNAFHVVFFDGEVVPSLSNVPASIGIARLENEWELSVLPGIEIEKPLQIISIMSHRQMRLTIGQGAQLSIVQTTIGTGEAIEKMNAVLEAGSQLHIVDESRVEEGAKRYCHFQAALKKNATLNYFLYSEGAILIEQTIDVALNEEGALANICGLERLSGAHQTRTVIHVDHRVPLCSSRQYFKKILDQESFSSLYGKVRIEPGAQKTSASHRCHHLLLSRFAHGIAKPTMEILADDVSATHAATFSQPNEEEIFYFRSRGLSDQAARKLYIDGFCREMMEEIPLIEMRNRLLRRGEI